VAIVVRGRRGLVLPSTLDPTSAPFLAALDELQAGGSTAGGEGIKLAHQVAQQNHIANGNNRVILATDGDFNVGVSSEGELVRLIESRKQQGTYLTVLGFGTGNLKDSRMEALADKGNGHYAYVDDIMEARKVFVQEMGATLVTIAKDAKVQVEFNPAQVAEYRLIGYENRLMAAEDFNDDAKVAGSLVPVMPSRRSTRSSSSAGVALAPALIRSSTRLPAPRASRQTNSSLSSCATSSRPEPAPAGWSPARSVATMAHAATRTCASPPRWPSTACCSATLSTRHNRTGRTSLCLRGRTLAAIPAATAPSSCASLRWRGE
jgi:hypothetical protein